MAEQKKPLHTQDLTADGMGDASGEAWEADTGAESTASMDDQSGAASAGEAGVEDRLRTELDRSQAELAEANQRFVRTQADFENYRRRMTREKEDLAVYANQKLLLKFLPVLDNLERALSAPKAEGDDKLRQGVELTARSFREALTSEGLMPIEAVGQPFDPNLHEAVMTVDSADHEDGTVIMEFQRGYRLGDRVIRPTMVQVSKKG